jgi:hypothetical protein
MAERKTVEVLDSDRKPDQKPFDRLKELLGLPDLERTAVISSYYDFSRQATIFEVQV